MHPPVTDHGGATVPTLVRLASKGVTSTTRILLTARIQRIKNLKLALNSVKSTEYVLFLIGNLIDDFDFFRSKLKNKHDDYKRMETLHLRFRKELNIIYNQISNGIDFCTESHDDGACDCYDSLYDDSLELISFMQERLF